jgi:hypothetical protein
MTAVVHMVMWRLDGATVQARRTQAQGLVAAFAALRGKMPGLLRLEVGTNLIDTADACDVALYTVFDSPQALDAYNAHPEHLKIKAMMAPWRAARCQADFELESL